MKCILKITSQSVTHMQSFKEVCDMVQNGYEDLTETASLKVKPAYLGLELLASTACE